MASDMGKLERYRRGQHFGSSTRNEQEKPRAENSGISATGTWQTSPLDYLAHSVSCSCLACRPVSAFLRFDVLITAYEFMKAFERC
jgi:hypothetical protein